MAEPLASRLRFRHGVGMSGRSIGHGPWLVILAASMWGSWSLFLRPANLQPTHSALLLFAVSGVLGTILGRRESAPRLTTRTFALLGLYAVADIANVVTFFGAMHVTTVAVAVLTHYLAPVWVALLSPYVEGKRVPYATVAALVALAGLGLLLAPTPTASAGQNLWLGAALGTASSIAYCVIVFTASRLQGDIGPARTLGWHALIAIVLMAPLLWTGVPQFEGVTLMEVEPSTLGLVLVAAVLLGTVAGLMFLRGIALIGPARASILAFFEPVVATAIGVWVMDEPMAPSGIVGVAFILAAGMHVTSPTLFPSAVRALRARAMGRAARS